MKTNPFDPVNGQAVADMVNAFLKWPLPKSVCADRCCSEPEYKHRSGTNLLTMGEAVIMMQEVVCRIVNREMKTLQTELSTAREVMERSARTLTRWAPECFPEIVNGQKHFVRVLMESVAEELRGATKPTCSADFGNPEP